MSRIYVAALIENGFFVCFSISIGVFKDQDSIAFFPFFQVPVGDPMSIIDDFANPDAAQMIDINISRVGQQRLSGKKSNFQFRMDIELAGRCCWIVDIVVARQRRIRGNGEHR